MTGIIHIKYDDSGYQDFGCFGHPYIQTPNIDAIATAGRKFTRFLLASPVCSTSRAAFITGLEPQYHGIHWVDSPISGQRYWLPPGTPTVASRLKELGWVTGYFGKSHWGAPPHTLLPWRFGYDEFLGYLVSPNSQFPAYLKLTNCHFISPTAPPTAYPGYVVDVECGAALAFVEARLAAGGNWYCELNVHSPHEPETFDVPELSLYPAGTYTEAERYYASVMSHVDTWIGDIVSAIDAAGALGETYIFITSDNGPAFLDEQHPHSAGLTAPWRGYKSSLYMGGICVPAVMRGPGISAGSTDAQFRSSLDWLPTCCAIAGYDTSDIPPPGVRGHSLLSPVPSTRYLCIEYHGAKQQGTTPSIPPNEWTIAKSGDGVDKWKLLSTDGGVSDKRLFDLDADPGETTDVGGANAAIRDELASELAAWDATWTDEVAASHSFPIDTPSTETEAVTPDAEPVVWAYVARCIDGSDRTSKLALIDKLFGYPNTSECAHGLGDANVTTYGVFTTTHPTIVGVPTIILGAEVLQVANEATYRANLNASELEELDTMIRESTGLPIA